MKTNEEIFESINSSIKTEFQLCEDFNEAWLAEHSGEAAAAYTRYTWQDDDWYDKMFALGKALEV